MKIAGVSLMAAARPTPAPFHRRPSAWARSTSTSVISRRLIWPKPSVWATGSRPRTTPAVPSVRPARMPRWVAPSRPARPKATQRAPTRAARLAPVMTKRSTPRPRCDISSNASTASGV